MPSYLRRHWSAAWHLAVRALTALGGRASVSSALTSEQIDRLIAWHAKGSRSEVAALCRALETSNMTRPQLERIVEAIGTRAALVVEEASLSAAQAPRHKSARSHLFSLLEGVIDRSPKRGDDKEGWRQVIRIMSMVEEQGEDVPTSTVEAVCKA